LWLRAEEIFERAFARYGYEPLRTPIFEHTDVFLRAVGEETDIVSKEMYTFTDRGGRSITLRPENTAAVIRAYLENGMHRLGGVTRLSYIGPMFRYDRPQAGRFRQFHQVGVEAIGSESPALDAEVIDLILHALEALGFSELAVKLNSVGCAVCRKPYLQALQSELERLQARLCEDCVARTANNPLRVFDCKRCVEVKDELPSISDHLCEACSAHFAEVRSLLDALGRRYEVDRRLVRGLDYYTRTTFEILHGALGAQNALCGGGRYDNLVEQCGGPPTPAVGFSAGLERILSVLPQESPAREGAESRPDFYVACVDEAATHRALLAARELRRAGATELDVSMRALKTQLKAAEKSGCRFAVIVESATPGRVKWKNMATREQTEIEDHRLFERASRETAGE